MITGQPGEAAQTAEDQTILSMRLKPHRSLTQKNFRLLIVLFSATSFISCIPFILLGAWPVAGFVGLDVAALYFAFRANFRAARAYEDLSITPFALDFAKVSAKGKRAEWHFNPAWVRLDREEHEEFGTQRLTFVSHGRSVEVAPFFGAEEKANLAVRLSTALAEARRGPRFS